MARNRIMHVKGEHISEGGGRGFFTEETPAQQLQRSAQTDLWAFSFPLQSTTLGQLLINVQAVDPANARPWVLSLNAYRFQGNFSPAVSTATYQVPPDNQTNVSFNSPLSPLVTNVPLQLRVQYLVRGAVETFRMDYPARGGSLQLTGGAIQVYVDAMSPGGFFNIPSVSGFIAPGIKPSASAPYSSRPTLTYMVAIAASSTVTVPVPDRAFAYRAYGSLGSAVSAASNPPKLQQTDGNFGAPQVWSLDNDGTLLSVSGQFANGQAGQTFRLDPRAQAVQVSNISAGGTNTYTLQFLLDVGG